jgi:hypothetical protein
LAGGYDRRVFDFRYGGDCTCNCGADVVLPSRHSDEPIHVVELSFQILNCAALFSLKFCGQLFELSLCSLDRLLKQLSTFVEIATDVMHRSSPLGLG